MTLPQAFDLALQHHQAGRLAEAERLYRDIIAQAPNHADALHFLGVIADQVGRHDNAVDLIGRAIALRPDYPEALGNLSGALANLGRLDDAIAACRNAIAALPDCAEAHYNLALMLLMQNNWTQGWAEHEWRWRVKNFPSPRWSYTQPQWDGSELTSVAILIHCEQGFGDTIQFSRYIPLVAERCGSVIATCHPQLLRLLESVPGARWQAWDAPRPPFDAQCPMLSLPLVFGTTPATIPCSIPYLRADAADANSWQRRIDSPHRSFNVGLAWAGSPIHTKDHKRSIPLSLLAPLANIEGVRYFSLQKEKSPGDSPVVVPMTDWSNDLHDFADTAALIAILDLVITADTAIAHLAGAMGKPVWTLLSFVPDWRWSLHRQDSPWYPTMRLFRQPSIGDWASVVACVVEALRGCAQSR